MSSDSSDPGGPASASDSSLSSSDVEQLMEWTDPSERVAKVPTCDEVDDFELKMATRHRLQVRCFTDGYGLASVNTSEDDEPVNPVIDWDLSLFNCFKYSKRSSGVSRFFEDRLGQAIHVIRLPKGRLQYALRRNGPPANYVAPLGPYEVHIRPRECLPVDCRGNVK